jgi:aminopeptidase C
MLERQEYWGMDALTQRQEEIRKHNIFNAKKRNACISSQKHFYQQIERLVRFILEPVNKFSYTYPDKNREGDHICYISDLSKFKAQYPGWNITRYVNDILEEIVKMKVLPGIKEVP